MGYGRGSVGDVILSRNGGVQTSRARNRQPRNPKSPLQCAQRSIQKCVAQAYSMLRPICNHSFEGQTTATENQARFTKLNVQMMREKAAACLGDPATLTAATVTSYPGADTVDLLYNDFIVSEGTLAPPVFDFGEYVGGENSIQILGLEEYEDYTDISFELLYNSMGLEFGDQLTLVCLYGGYDFYEYRAEARVKGMTYARICCKDTSLWGREFMESVSEEEILRLGLQDYEHVVKTRSDIANNEGEIYIGVGGGRDDWRWHIVGCNGVAITNNIPSGASKDQKVVTGWALIRSNYTDGWRRSPARLNPGSIYPNAKPVTLGAAVQSFMEADRLSGKYLNQAK